LGVWGFCVFAWGTRRDGLSGLLEEYYLR